MKYVRLEAFDRREFGHTKLNRVSLSKSVVLVSPSDVHDQKLPGKTSEDIRGGLSTNTGYTS